MGAPITQSPAGFKRENAFTSLMYGAGAEKAVRVGAIGHRVLHGKSIDLIHKGIDEALAYTRRYGRHLGDRIPWLVILSSLAEGADRLVAKEALRGRGFEKVDLEVVLPMRCEEYANDFASIDSTAEFKELLDLSASVKVMEETSSREEGYELAGRFIVDHCDLLIAIWDGQKAAGRGGTGDIARYAVKSCRPVLWIDSESGALRVLDDFYQ